MAKREHLVNVIKHRNIHSTVLNVKKLKNVFIPHCHVFFQLSIKIAPKTGRGDTIS